MARLIHSITWAIDRLAVALFVILFAVVIAQVVFRYVFNSPLAWSEELARYLFVWISFTGWLMATRRQDHIGLTWLRDRLPGASRRGWLIVLELVHLGLAVVLALKGWEIAMRNLNVGAVSLPIPFALVYGAVPFAGAVSIVLCLGRLYELASQRDIAA